MKAGKLTQRITIQRATETINEVGSPILTWSDFASRWAEKVEQSTSEFIRDYGATDETAIVFRTWYIEGVTGGDRVFWGGQAFNIKGIVVLGQNLGHELRCVRID